MKAFIRKWGNGTAVRIPPATLAAVGLEIGDPVEVREENGRIVIEKPGRGSATLERLIQGITPDNLHDETDWGRAVGREAW